MAEENRVFHVLPVPDAANTSAQAIEVMRAWIIDQQLTLTLSPNVFDRPDVWGTLLADCAFHVANAMSQLQAGVDVPETMKQIQESFNQKMKESNENRGSIQVASS